ncbi:hypothetical protein Q8G35_13940 [Peribacillus simplex]|uniref:Uncharacterized protein n=2 Tax=Peribacillus TaxID=2675229 RepID=A0AA90SWR4_9BACI|nr:MULTISPECIES: hypothetical protein [Peribacillus]MDP1419507.1 hypothetical protein [Peribacillus simplex]MDP1452340.1 hypothetical protein [Peribacillus frigoritolerans]
MIEVGESYFNFGITYRRDCGIAVDELYALFTSSGSISWVLDRNPISYGEAAILFRVKTFYLNGL